MTKREMKLLARKIGILAIQKKELEDAIKELKKQLSPHMSNCKQEEKPDGKIHFILEDVTGFTCKRYDRTQLFANQKVARKLLHANTFNAIFKPTDSVIVDIRPTAATKRLAVEQLIADLERDQEERETLAQAS